MEALNRYSNQEIRSMNLATAPFAPAQQKTAESPLAVDDSGSDEYIVSFSDVMVNLDRALVVRSGKKVALTSAELELLTFFLQNPDKALTRDMILETVWSYLPSPNTRTVDAHVLRLRQKLEAEPDAPRHFVTVHKVGYRFSPNGLRG
jgi:DNA-binding response OmpR family regulator